MNTKIINYPEQPLKISDLPEYLYDLSKDQLFDLFVNNKIQCQHRQINISDRGRKIGGKLPLQNGKH